MSPKHKNPGNSARSISLAKSSRGNVSQSGDRNLAIIVNVAGKDESITYEKAEEKYRQAVIHRYGTIRVPHFDRAPNLSIDALYVPPTFEKCQVSSDKIVKHQQPSVMDDFLANLNRTVVLGMPGGGKSTLAMKLCYDIASKRQLLNGRNPLPIFITLRDYSQSQKGLERSFVEHISATARTELQLGVPSEFFERALDRGDAFVVFDGLDELTDTSLRRKVRDNVESFCNHYKEIPVLVTSREVGYSEAPLNTKDFDAYKLAPFSRLQVQKFVTQWFGLDSDLTPHSRDEKIKGFLKESSHVAELSANPLMLALMCNIYRRKNYIPTNRPAVYEQCADMLFEAWDKGRGIGREVDDCYLRDIDEYGKPLIGHLAHHIYEKKRLQSGVSEEGLVDIAVEYLSTKYQTEEKAEAFAKAFVTVCKGRAWVFTNVGSTDDGQELYQFTHRTFLEYFTALHIVRVSKNIKSIEDLIIPRISKQEWDVIAQLVIQLQNRRAEGAGDRLLSTIVKKARQAGGEQRWTLLYFLARTLGFMVPKESLVRTITQECLLEAITMKPSDRHWMRGYSIHPNFGFDYRVTSAFVLAAETLGSTKVHPEITLQAAEEFLSKAIVSTDEEKAVGALHCALNLPSFCGGGDPWFPRDTELRDKFDQCSREFVQKHKNRILKLTVKSPRAAYDAFRWGMVSAKFLYDTYDLPGIFYVPEDPGLAPAFAPAAVLLLLDFLGINAYRCELPDEVSRKADLSFVGGLLSCTPSPTKINSNYRAGASMFLNHLFVYRKTIKRSVELDNASLAESAFRVLATQLEIASKMKGFDFNAVIKRHDFDFGPFDPYIRLRFEGKQTKESKWQSDLAMKWAQKAINFVR